MAHSATPSPGPADGAPAPVGKRPAWWVLLLKVRVWLGDYVKLTDLQVNLLYAGIVGLTGGIASVAFRQLTHLLTALLTWHWPATENIFTLLPWWQRLLTPTLGGLAAGLLLWWGSRVGRSGTSTDYMEAIALGDGVVPFRYSLVKTGSALFTSASGGSIGREGPVVALAAVLASLLGRWTRLPTPRLRLLVACGAAAGLASVQNAPIAGAFFVAEIILGQVVMESFGPLVFASVVATQTVQNFLGANPLYEVPAFTLNSNLEMLPYALMGLLLGFVGAGYLRFLRLSEWLFATSGIPIWLRLGLGGAIVGALAIQVPEVHGNGYTAINDLFHREFLWRTVFLILVFKLVATAATFGSGAVGGVFTPTLFVGAFLGYSFGVALRFIFPHAHLNPLAFALVGMGAFLAAATQAPLMSILVLVELTRDYQIILPLMLGCVLAYYTCRGAAGGASIYSESLKRQAEREDKVEPDWAHILVGDLMRPDPPAVPASAGFQRIAENFITSRFLYLYVTGADGRFEGAISLHDVKPYLNNPELADVIIAGDIVREDFLRVPPRSTLREALATFALHDGERLPVVEDEAPRGGSIPGITPGRLVGSLSKSDLLLAITSARRPEDTASATMAAGRAGGPLN